MSAEKFTVERIITLQRWTPYLLSFRTSRHANLRFLPGQYARLCLHDANGREVWRPYSMVSASYDEHLEFFSILIPNGEFTTLLQQRRIGDELLIDKSSYGFLTTDRFDGGEDLWLLATGTGLAPFISILHDPQVWNDYRRLIVVHSVRYVSDLAYRDTIAALPQHPLIGAAAEQLTYIPVVTRESFPGGLSGRIPALIENGALEARSGVAFHPEKSRIMICGNPDMVSDTRKCFKAMGYALSRRGQPAQLVIENAF